MLKQFAQFLSEMKETKIFDVNGKKLTNDPDLEEIIPHVDRPSLMTVSSLDAICKLVRTETILPGASGGAVIAAVDMLKDTFEPGSDVVVILHDSGTRYMDTIYNDNWVEENL